MEKTTTYKTAVGFRCLRNIFHPRLGMRIRITFQKCLNVFMDYLQKTIGIRLFDILRGAF